MTGPWWDGLAFHQAGAALHGEEGGEQHLEVIAAAVQPRLAQGALGGLHHGDHQAVAAGGALPVAIRRELQGRGDRLYSRAWQSWISMGSRPLRICRAVRSIRRQVSRFRFSWLASRAIEGG